jgi:hypothetical protein
VQTANPISLNNTAQCGEQDKGVRSLFDTSSDKRANPAPSLILSNKNAPPQGFGGSKVRLGAYWLIRRVVSHRLQSADSGPSVAMSVGIIETLAVAL